MQEGQKYRLDEWSSRRATNIWLKWDRKGKNGRVLIVEEVGQ